MKKISWLFLAALLVLSGCARGYVITMDNGARVRAATKPKLVRGFYYFKDALGNDADPVYSGEVKEIAPASMASKDPASNFKPVSSR